MTLSEVAEAAAITRAGARRILLTLQTLGYVTLEERQFRLTAKILSLGYSYLGSLDFWSFAEPAMQALVERVHESCSASVLDGRRHRLRAPRSVAADHRHQSRGRQPSPRVRGIDGPGLARVAVALRTRRLPQHVDAQAPDRRDPLRAGRSARRDRDRRGSGVVPRRPRARGRSALDRRAGAKPFRAASWPR